MAENGEDVPLGPLNEIIRRFKKRQKAISIMWLLSLPANVMAILVFLLFAVSTMGFSAQSAVIFGFLTFSAFISFMALLYISDSFSTLASQAEVTAGIISFAITPPTGESPEKRVFNQLVRTDDCIRNVVKKNPSCAHMNAKIPGKSGRSYDFDVYIQNLRALGKFFNISTDVNAFVKRYDTAVLTGEESVSEVKHAVQDVLAKNGRRIPNRVLIVSTSGFEEEAFDYVRSKKGYFNARFSSLTCGIELIKENVDGTFDVLSF